MPENIPSTVFSSQSGNTFENKIYTFMNKNTELFDVEMDRGQAESLSNFRQENLHLLPVFLLPKRNMGVSRRDFNDWWSNRRIPASRDGVKEVLWHLKDSGWHEDKVFGLDELAEKCLGLSLSDQFWIRPSANTTWDCVNFFTNNFSEDIGNLLTTGEWSGGSLSSPDNTSDGVVRKKWKIIDGQRCLLKGSFSTVGIPQAQPFREVFASKIAALLLEPFGRKDFVTPYTLLQEEGRVYSVCPNFITPDTEYVSFNQIHQAFKKPNDVAPYEFCKQFYGKYDYVLDLTFILDFIVLNEDRHFGNFGIIRSADTGEFLRPAPIFDTGSSLFFDSQSTNSFRVESKPFSKSFRKQLEKTNYQNYQASIQLVHKHYQDIFDEVFCQAFEGEERIDKLRLIVGNHIKTLLS